LLSLRALGHAGQLSRWAPVQYGLRAFVVYLLHYQVVIGWPS
jgi:hypothetical protein